MQVLANATSCEEHRETAYDSAFLQGTQRKPRVQEALLQRAYTPFRVVDITDQTTLGHACERDLTIT
jgi:hypothetical protein